MENKIKNINLGIGEDFKLVSYHQLPSSVDTIVKSNTIKDLDKLFQKKFGSKRIN